MAKERQDGLVFDEDERLQYDWPVTFVKPGGSTKHVVMLTFLMKDMDELAEIEERLAEEDDPNSLCCELVVQWPTNADAKKTFFDKDGTTPLPVTEENKRKVFNRIYIARQTMEAFFQSQGGKKRR